MNKSPYGTDAMRELHQRFDRLPAPDPIRRLQWRSGTLADYQPLAGFHYLRHRPATATRVIVAEDPRPTAIDRFTGSPEPPRVVAVLVESLPALSCRLRDQALDGRYADWSDRRFAARLLNAEMRCISRVVVHPQWRGLGLAVELVRRALTTMTTAYTEALAAMGRVHPFFKRAGMTEYRRWPLQRDQRLIDALARVDFEPWRLADTRHMQRWLVGGDHRAEFIREELARWAGRRLPLADQLLRARDHLLREPLYYLKAREDESIHHTGSI